MIKRKVVLRAERREARTRARARRAIVALVTGAFLAIAVATTMRVSAARVRLQIDAESISFTVARPRLLTSGLPVRSFAATGLSFSKDEAGATRPAAHVSALVSEAAERDDGGIWVQPIDVELGARVRARAPESSQDVELTIEQSPPAQIVLAWSGAVDWAYDGELRATSGAQPQSLELAAESALALTLSPRETACIVCFPVEVDAVELEPTGLMQKGVSLLDVNYSPIHAARYVFPEVSAEASELGFREPLQIDVWRNRAAGGAVVRRITRSGDTLHIELDAMVSGLRSGVGETRQDLMPSVLDWILAQRGATAVWSGVVYVATLLVAFARWLGVEK
jgi:hypothetical protein